ncbi:HAD family hydrolase [Enterococcus sp. JM4C]|uniref:HAD family hydrolase n=1 Tax=Candidatus Enterococcus huntleyi TaxID=1857217 RepID=UPI00137B277E|nr:HAD family hydrolase [Enterococcus sp. JM4C]KAF1296138.1 HAD family hydrolase [Enterococcus sp. JM4C]
MAKQTPFEQAEEFHRTFDPRRPAVPTAFSAEEASFRAGFKQEELVELLYAASNNDLALFEQLTEQLQQDLLTAKAKVLAKNEPVADVLVEEVDALVDMLYFTYGSFSLMGVNPMPIFEIVHRANMGKLFPDGKPHYDPITNKVLKPENWAKDYAPEAKIAEEIERQRMAAEADKS